MLSLPVRVSFRLDGSRKPSTRPLAILQALSDPEFNWLMSFCRKAMVAPHGLHISLMATYTA